MKQSAWLNTVPEKAKRPRRETRPNAPMPPLGAEAYLIEILFEIGPTKPAGMGGQIGIDETDLVAWQQNQRANLKPWECRTIRLLSREYAGMLFEASKPDCPQPFVAKLKLSDEQRAKISEAMGSWADKLNKAKRK